MKLPEIDVFFSCSFQENDRRVIEFFSAICSALSIKPMNVSTGYSETPADVARGMIQAAAALIGVATRREKAGNEEWSTSQSVRDELSMAFGLRKPILLFVEKGVKIDGMMSNFCTYLLFDRKEQYEPRFLEKAVESLYNLKLSLLVDDAPSQKGASLPCYADSVHTLIELEKVGNEFIWTRSETKKLTFTATFDRPLKTGVWTDTAPEMNGSATNIEWKIEVSSGSRNFEIVQEVEKETPEALEISLRFTPTPSARDWIEYITYAKSRHFNPVFADEVVSGTEVIQIHGKKFQCNDGDVISYNTNSLHIQFRFPKDYGLKTGDFHPIAGLCTRRLDYLDEGEISRMSTEASSFGGNLIVSLKVESPKLGHMYGLTWNPPPRP